ncbi:MAG TPA: EAL domain-containing protein, partial [Novosphingobium sp.]|nr:EAL domain-containing protein [Novosphingobium sp.]
AMLMTISAVIIPTVPLATLLFSAIVGGTSVAAFAVSHQYGMAGVSALFVSCIGLGTIEASRHFLLSRLAAAGLDEGREVVRLLLREYDDDEADWLWLLDGQRRVRSVSPRFAEALGMDPHKIEGESFLKLVAGPHEAGVPVDDSLHALADRLKGRESFSNLLVRVTVRGEQRWWELSGTPRRDDNGAFVGFRGVASDVTDERESAEKITYLARYDTLTGLPNRTMIIDTLGEALIDARTGGWQCAFLMMDLDRFKAVNDTLGHPVGDALLAAVADRLRVLMGANMICGRLGGDEFCIVIRSSDVATVTSLANLIIESLSQSYQIDNNTISIGASVGSAMGPRDGGTVEELMRNADFALYRAKNGGRGRHFAVDEGLHAETRVRRQMERELRKAVTNGELELAFQPEVDAQSDQVVSLEALLRWNSREHGTLTPGRFLNLAEESRLILPIGEWVLGEACREAANWPERVRVAVNISGRQLLDPAFIDHVVKALSSSGLAPQRLCLEVREVAFQRDAALVRAMIERVIGLGCSVCLDDFGAGPTALSQLCELNFSSIKLDRALVRGAGDGNTESVALIRAAVAMAESLEIEVTAKGVETQREIDLVRELGCRRIQGSAYGRPMDCGQAAGLFQRRHRDSAGA